MYALATASLCLIIALSGLRQGATTHAKDEAAIRDVVKEYLASRERRDAAALGALFTSDADQLVSSGEWRKGRDALVKGTLTSSAAHQRQPHDRARDDPLSGCATSRSPTAATRSPAAKTRIAGCGRRS